MRKLKSIDEIYCVSNRLLKVEQNEIDAAQAALQATFPPGFTDWMLKFGEGDFSGYFRPYRPKRVLTSLAQNRDVLKNDFWRDGDIRLDEAQRTRMIVFADTIDSDFFALDPADSSQIYLFPRQSCEIRSLKPDFVQLLDWAATSGNIVQPFAAWYFQPWTKLTTLRFAPRNTPTAEEVGKSLLPLGKPDYVIEAEDRLDFFIQKFGFHLSCSLTEDYRDVTAQMDAESSEELLPRLASCFSGLGFKVKESSGVAKTSVAELFPA